MKKILFLVSILIPSIVFAGPHVRNESQSTLYSAEGDTQPTSAVDRYGNQMCTMAAGTASATNPIIPEDTAFPDLQALVAVGVKLQSALSVDAAANDAGSLKAGLDGRLITANAPAGETFQNCYASAITDTATYAIKTAVASNRIYVTDIECTNASTVASLLIFADGGTTVLYGALSNTTVDGIGKYQKSLQTPIRGTVNTAFNVTLGTTATNTRCCIYGYISVN